jgi:DNA-binding NarL/FixJ family response regulator
MKKTAAIRIIVADDHEIYRDGLVATLQAKEGFEVIASCQDGDQLIRATQRLNPDIIITDLRMPVKTGVEAIKAIHVSHPGIRCLALSTFDNEFMIVDALESGALGYITKSMPKIELFEAIESIQRGLPYYCQSTSHKLVRMIAGSFFNPYSKEKRGLFTEAEKHVIKLICEDKSVKEIAAILFMSERTVENHRSKLFKKMNVKTTAGIAIYAIKHSLYFIYEG